MIRFYPTPLTDEQKRERDEKSKALYALSLDEILVGRDAIVRCLLEKKAQGQAILDAAAQQDEAA